MEKERKYWNPEAETMPSATLHDVQLSKLQSQMRYAYDNSSLHRRVWDEAGVHPDGIKTLEDFWKRVPFIDKDMVRREQQRTGEPSGGMLCVAENKLLMISTSSGTTGLPTFLPVSRLDFETCAEQWARFFWGIGTRQGDKFQLALFGWHRGNPCIERAMDKIGTIRIRTDLYALPPEIARNYYVARHLKPAFCHIVTAPLIEGMEAEAQKDGLSPGDLFSCYRAVTWSGDVLSDGLRRRMSERWRTEIFEVGGLGDLNFYCVECSEHDGMHVCDDLFLIEIVDPKTKEVLPPGEEGVLVITTLTDEAIPAIRWWSEDICYLNPEPCRCGRTTKRLRYLGRQMYRLQIAGRFLFPSQIAGSVEQIPETSHGMFQVIKYAAQMPVLRLRVGYQPAKTSDEAGLRARIATQTEKDLQVHTEVELVPLEQLTTLGPPHKIPRVVDLTR